MKADGDKFAPNHHKMFSSLSVSLSPSLPLPLLARSIEAEGHRDHVSAGGEGATLQGDVGGLEYGRGGLPAG